MDYLVLSILWCETKGTKMTLLSDTQKIFALSTVNGQDNCQDLLPINGREWPRDTWLARRLRELKEGVKRGEE